jgi:hypothetical protein
MAMWVRERTGVVAVLKALGFTPGMVHGLFVTEGVVLAAPAKRGTSPSLGPCGLGLKASTLPTVTLVAGRR